jgi:hypothetical protein
MLPPILPDLFVPTRKRCTVLYISAPRHLQNDGTGERGWGGSSAGSGEEGPARGHRYDPFAEEEVHNCSGNRICCLAVARRAPPKGTATTPSPKRRCTVGVDNQVCC